MKLNINDEQEVELLHWIFERELKPPFTKGEKDMNHDLYYNRDGECIGSLRNNNSFIVRLKNFSDIKYKVRYAFELPNTTYHLWDVIEPHLKSWMENQINIKLRGIYL